MDSLGKLLVNWVNKIVVLIFWYFCLLIIINLVVLGIKKIVFVIWEKNNIEDFFSVIMKIWLVF